MQDILPNFWIRNKYVFANIPNPAFTKNLSEAQVSAPDIHGPVLDAIRQEVKTTFQRDLETLYLCTDRVLLANGFEWRWSFSFLILLNMMVPVGTRSQLKSIKVAVSKSLSPLQSSLGGFSFAYSENPYGTNNRLVSTFLKEAKIRLAPVFKYEYNYGLNNWILSRDRDKELRIEELLTQPSLNEAKIQILTSYDDAELQRDAVKDLKLYQDFHKGQFVEPAPFAPAPFCHWGITKIETLANHNADHKLNAQKSCPSCRELLVWRVLKHWYDTVFLSCKQFATIELNGGRKVQELLRKKALIILGTRRTGKTNFVKNLVDRQKQHYAFIKGSFSRANSKNITLDTWLLAIDDLNWEDTDYEVMKAILASEETTLTGKWLSEAFRSGIPCVVLTNNRAWYKKMQKDPNFTNECSFANVEDFYLGPEDSERDPIHVFNGPTKTFSSNETSQTEPLPIFPSNKKTVSIKEFQELHHRYAASKVTVASLKDEVEKLKQKVRGFEMRAEHDVENVFEDVNVDENFFA